MDRGQGDGRRPILEWAGELERLVVCASKADGLVTSALPQHAGRWMIDDHRPARERVTETKYYRVTAQGFKSVQTLLLAGASFLTA